MFDAVVLAAGNPRSMHSIKVRHNIGKRRYAKLSRIVAGANR